MILPDYFKGLGHTNKWVEESKKPVLTLAERFAYRITSAYNKDVLFLLVGERGSGKSYTLLSLALGVAKEVARIKGGKPEDYFTFNNVAVIQEDDLIQRMQNLEQYNVYILDDAGVGWDSRDFATKTNKILNHILQVCRTANTCILISVPDPMLIDKVPRTQVRYYGEISEQFHDKGFTLVKVFKNERLFREGKTLQVYIREGRTPIVRFVVPPPPRDIAEQYDVLRKVMAEHILATYEEGDMDRKVICPECNYSWIPRTPNPAKCPACQKRIGHKLRE